MFCLLLSKTTFIFTLVLVLQGNAASNKVKVQWKNFTPSSSVCNCILVGALRELSNY